MYLYPAVLLEGFVWHLSLKWNLKIFEKYGIAELCLSSSRNLLKMVSGKYELVRSIFYRWLQEKNHPQKTTDITMIESVNLKVNLIWTNSISSLSCLWPQFFKWMLFWITSVLFEAVLTWINQHFQLWIYELALLGQLNV